MPAPNRQYPGIDSKQSGHRWPATDEEARRAGLAKFIRLSDNVVEYHHPVDRHELEASGAYRSEPWE